MSLSSSLRIESRLRVFQTIRRKDSPRRQRRFFCGNFALEDRSLAGPFLYAQNLRHDEMNAQASQALPRAFAQTPDLGQFAISNMAGVRSSSEVPMVTSSYVQNQVEVVSPDDLYRVVPIYDATTSDPYTLVVPSGTMMGGTSPSYQVVWNDSGGVVDATYTSSGPNIETGSVINNLTFSDGEAAPPSVTSSMTVGDGETLSLSVGSHTGKYVEFADSVGGPPNSYPALENQYFDLSNYDLSGGPPTPIGPTQSVTAQGTFSISFTPPVTAPPNYGEADLEFQFNGDGVSAQVAFPILTIAYKDSSGNHVVTDSSFGYDGGSYTVQFSKTSIGEQSNHVSFGSVNDLTFEAWYPTNDSISDGFSWSYTASYS